MTSRGARTILRQAVCGITRSHQTSGIRHKSTNHQQLPPDGAAPLSTATAPQPTTENRPPPWSYSSKAGPSLSEPLPGLKTPIYPPSPNHSFDGTQITKLDSGLRVVTEPKFGNSCTLGVIIEAGSRYEMAYPSGMCHVLEKLAYNSTQSYPSAAVLFKEFEQYGAVWDAQATKDLFIYAANCHQSGVEMLMRLIADTALRPLIQPEELTAAVNAVTFDTESLNSSPDCEQILTDWIHEAAFRGNSLGLPKLCPIGTAPNITQDMLYSYMSAHYTPERMVVVGIGTEHESFVEFAQKYFVDQSPIWKQQPELVSSPVPQIDNSVAQYTGGLVKIDRDLSKVGRGTPYPNLAHFVLGLQSTSFLDRDYVPMSVLNALMGGGCHFSSGGPGKGMYTRLYTQVLNLYHWMYNATSYNHAYADDGLYYIHASSDPSHLHDVACIVTDQMLRLNGEYSRVEVERAKAQLKSLLLMNLEMRPVQFEDTGRMIVGLGYRKSPMEFIDEIDACTIEDLQRCGDRLLSCKPSVVGYGELTGLPEYDAIQKAIAQRSLDPIQQQKKKRSFSFWK